MVVTTVSQPLVIPICSGLLHRVISHFKVFVVCPQSFQLKHEDQNPAARTGFMIQWLELPFLPRQISQCFGLVTTSAPPRWAFRAAFSYCFLTSGAFKDPVGPFGFPFSTDLWHKNQHAHTLDLPRGSTASAAPLAHGHQDTRPSVPDP